MQHICTSFKDLSVEDEIILTIGNFDGIHKGHSTILNKIKNEGDEKSKAIKEMVAKG